MIPNLAAIVQQAQSMGLDQNNSAVAPQPNNGGTVVGTGTSVNDLSYFSKPMGIEAQSADEVRAQATSNMMGQSQMPSSPINPKGFSRPEEEITNGFNSQRQEDLTYNPTKQII